MLESFKSFFASQGLGADFSAVSRWAKRCGYAFQRAPEGEGFGVDGTLEGHAWRLEWGPAQRPYVEGNELRLRMELGVPADLQVLLLTKPLLERLEREVFEHVTANNQTDMGDSTPEEQRWLVMFPKLELRPFRTLRAHLGGVSSLPADGQAWLEGALAHALVRACRRLLASDPPFVLMTLRGRAYLRLQLAKADVDDIGEALELFETAGTAALRVAAARHEPHQDFAQTASTAWQSLLPGRKSGREG